MLCVTQRNRYTGSVPTTASNTVNMPADYSAYLLSASPPGFDLGYAIRANFGGARTTPRRTCTAVKPNILYSSDGSDVTFTEEEYDEVTQGIASLFGEFQSRNSNTVPRYSQCEDKVMNKNKSNNNCVEGLKKKCVTFADDLGGSLVEVRLVYENTDDPPTLSQEILLHLAEGAQAAVTDAPPLTLNFTQPASNYMAFREKLEKGCVSLENVIVKEYHLLGTVKVKNISFEKKVLVRYTCDSWATVCDVDCMYVPATQTAPGSSGSSPYDTFSFQLNIPPTFDPSLKIQFSLMYETNGQQFWDNNEGKNYEVLCASHHEPPVKTQDNGVFDLNHDDRWTEFSNWSAVDNSVPYW